MAWTCLPVRFKNIRLQSPPWSVHFSVEILKYYYCPFSRYEIYFFNGVGGCTTWEKKRVVKHEENV